MPPFPWVYSSQPVWGVPRGGVVCTDSPREGGAMSVPLFHCVPILWVFALPPVPVSFPIPHCVALSLSLSRWWYSLRFCGTSSPLWCTVAAAPFPVGLLPLPRPFPRSFAAALPFSLSIAGALVVGWWWGPGNADGPCSGVGGLEPPPVGFGGVGGREAVTQVPEER